jgi:hypothetical protein
MTWGLSDYDDILRREKARNHPLTPKEEKDLELFEIIRFYEGAAALKRLDEKWANRPKSIKISLIKHVSSASFDDILSAQNMLEP